MATRALGSVKSNETVLLTSVNLASEITGILPVTNGGTGQSTFTDGQILVGNTTGNTLSKVSVSGDLSLSNAGVATIQSQAVTYAKIQNASANTVIARANAASGSVGEVALSASQLLGRGDTGDIAPITLGTNLSMSGTTLNASTSGSPLGLFDFWTEQPFGSSNAQMGPFNGAAISTGTNTAAIPTSSMFGYNPHGVLLRSSATANSGYKYQTSSLGADYFGVTSRKFRAQFQIITTLTSKAAWFGFFDSATFATNPTDACHFYLENGLIGARHYNNSANSSTSTIAANVGSVYTLDIEVNSGGTSARYRVYENTNTTAVLDTTLTTNIPTTATRGFGAGCLFVFTGTAATDIGILYNMGYGTIEGYTRARG